jgi:hypothetical protein
MKTATVQPATPPESSRRLTEDPLAPERRAFLRQRRQLLRRYPGQYVALYGGRVVGRDKDDEALAARMFAELGDVPFYIARLEKKPTVYDLPSPEVEG